jgi:hypothetical protein
VRFNPQAIDQAALVKRIVTAGYEVVGESKRSAQ